MEDEKIEWLDETIATSELLREKRKKAYEQAKAQRKADRLAEKQRKRNEKELFRAQRDKTLWNALRPAKDLDVDADENYSPEEPEHQG